jgi:hypothetical protein
MIFSFFLQNLSLYPEKKNKKKIEMLYLIQKIEKEKIEKEGNGKKNLISNPNITSIALQYEGIEYRI